MRLLDFDPETNGRTWLNPVWLDHFIPRSEYRGAAFVISGEHMIATTGPIMEDIPLLSRAWELHGDSHFSRDTRLFKPAFKERDIGLLRGNAGEISAAIELDVPKGHRVVETSDGLVPSLDRSRLDIILDYVGSHRGFRLALPTHPVIIRMRNYVDAVGHGGWLYDGIRFQAYQSEIDYLHMIGQL